jgi:polysaccharide pyruvyl transferase WcaK-like protein
VSGEKQLRDPKSPTRVEKGPKIVIFGNFGTPNFGNEATLRAIYFNLRRLIPEAEFACMCSFPAIASATHKIAAFPISPTILTGWTPKSRAARILKRIVFGIPNELYRLGANFRMLKDANVLIVPGTGLLTDVYDLLNWGPYGVFRWSVLAKLRGCKLLFVSVGVGPLYGRLGRVFAKLALGLADFRSYRDISSLEYVKSIGFNATNDQVYPDLAFSLPPAEIPRESKPSGGRPVVGLGLMTHGGMYGDVRHDDKTYRDYTETLITLTKWLLDQGYNVRLLIGEIGDPVTDFSQLLSEKLPSHECLRISHSTVASIDDLLSQFRDTEFVVVTRFHNIIFGLLNNKPVVSISFHPKCASLMADMGLFSYCLQIDQLNSDELIHAVIDIQNNMRELTTSIASRKDDYRRLLEEQYRLIVDHCASQ